jgi:WD40 repeat protein
LTAGADGEARLWDVGTGKPLGQPMRHGSPVRFAAFSPEGDRLATAGPGDGSPRMWDAHTGASRPLGSLGGYRPGPVHALAWSSDGSLLATANDTWNALVYNAKTGAALRALGQQGPIRAVAFGADRTVLTGSDDQSAQRWTETGARMGPLLLHQGAVRTVRVSAEGTFALTGGADGLARLWRLSASEWAIARIDQRPSAAINRVVFHSDGSGLTAGSSDGNVQPFALNGQPAGPARTVAEGVTAMACRPRGSGLAVVAGKSLFLAGKGDFGPPVPLPGPVWSLAWSPDGSTVALTSLDQLRLHDAETGQPAREPLLHPGEAFSVAYHPDGHYLATACADRAVRLWDVSTGAVRGEPIRHPGNLTGVAFSPDGRLLAVSSEDKTVRLWDPVTTRPVGLPLQHPGSLGGVAFSPDSRLLAASVREGSTYLWDVVTGKQVGPPLPAAGFVNESVFRPDGRALAVVNGHQVRLYPVPGPVQGAADRLTLWAQVRTGLELTPEGATQPLDAAGWRDRHQQLAEAGPVPEDLP